MSAIAISALYLFSSGKAEVMAAAPAQELTATVRIYPMIRAAPATRPYFSPRFSLATMYAPPP